MTHPELFAKETGMRLAAERNEVALRSAREVAIYIAEEKGEVSINDVREALPQLPGGNYMGSIFKGDLWLFTGKRVQARHEGSHAREVKVWKLNPHHSRGASVPAPTDRVA